MSRVLIQSAIKTILETVTDIGTVYDHIRWTNYQGKFIEAFVTEVDGQPQIRTWMINRAGGGFDYGPRLGSLGTAVDIPTNTNLAKYDFQVEGWLSFKDNDTDSEFQLLIDAIEDKFKANISLNDTCLVRGPITYQIDHQFFGEYFVHHIIMEFYAVEREGITPV
jgi:hypothetical protein